MEEEYARNKKNVFVPNYNYKDKYAHLIGQEAALDAAKKTETNQSYGFGMNIISMCVIITCLYFFLL